MGVFASTSWCDYQIRCNKQDKTHQGGWMALQQQQQLLRNGIFDVVVLCVHLASYVRIV